MKFIRKKIFKTDLHYLYSAEMMQFCRIMRVFFWTPRVRVMTCKKGHNFIFIIIKWTSPQYQRPKALPATPLDAVSRGGTKRAYKIAYCSKNSAGTLELELCRVQRGWIGELTRGAWGWRLRPPRGLKFTRARGSLQCAKGVQSPQTPGNSSTGSTSAVECESKNPLWG